MKGERHGERERKLDKCSACGRLCIRSTSMCAAIADSRVALALMDFSDIERPFEY